MHHQRADVAIIGAGIVGLAHALAVARHGLRVVLFERSEQAVGASIRNFGLVWPVGQPDGALQERALRTRAIWDEVATAASLWHAPTGSLLLAYAEDEEAVLHDYLATTTARDLGRRLMTPTEVAQCSPAARTEGLRCALWSPTEMTVDPQHALATLPHWLHHQHGVTLRFGTSINLVSPPTIETLHEQWHVDHIFVCSGNDFETLYPRLFAASQLTRCKLQMLRTVPQPDGWQLGPALCAGLTLLHYAAFRHCASLGALRQRITDELPFYTQQAIHVLVSQTSHGAITLGDHHEYGLTHTPFDREEINAAILAYLARFARFPRLTIAERWHGIYPILPGQADFVAHPETGVTVVNGLGGAGMTLSFGLAEEIVAQTLGLPVVVGRG